MINIGILLIIIGITLILSKILSEPLNKNYPQKNTNTKNNFSIIIPARDESEVIEDLLISIENQTQKINPKNIYVIIEDKKDKTYEIVKKHNMNIFIRKKLNLKRKGYAIMELIEDLDKKQKYYDAYFIFDADNILDKNYIKEMTSTYNKGYEIGIGYRNIKNKNNPLAISSGLIFIIINSLINKRRNKTTLNKIISGSGFYIKDSLIKKWKTYPFHTLTEDYELTLYSIINNTSTYYNKNAKFYDEQPTEYKVYKIERTRWIKGYFETRKKYRKELLKKLSLKNKNYSSVYNELIGVWDIIILLIGLLLIIINMLLNLNTKVITNIIKIILIIYISLVIFTLIILKTENKNLKLTNKMKIQVSLIHPLLLFSYIPCAIKAIFTKNLTWIKIEHKEHLKE